MFPKITLAAGWRIEWRIDQSQPRMDLIGAGRPVSQRLTAPWKPRRRSQPVLLPFSGAHRHCFKLSLGHCLSSLTQSCLPLAPRLLSITEDRKSCNSSLSVLTYIHHAFFTKMYFWCFDIGSLADQGGTSPPRVSQFLEISKPHSCEDVFHMQTRHSRAYTLNFYWALLLFFAGLLPSGPLFFCPNHPRDRYRLLAEPTEIIQTSQS